MSEQWMLTTLGEADANHNFASLQYLAQSDASLRPLANGTMHAKLRQK
jgi:hypothetical protein